MSVFKHLLGLDEGEDISSLLPVIERAVTSVEPLLKQTGGYPDDYRKTVSNALEYAHALALKVPGPVEVNRESYARDAYVHAIFPSLEFVSKAFCASRAIQEYRQQHPATNEIFALMGMRRLEKSMMGMELSGQAIQRDVPQEVVYFSSHTIENPAPTEQQAREQIAWSFFDKLVGKVAERVKARRQEKQSQTQQLEMLMARLHAADAESRPSLEAEISGLMSSIQSTTTSLELDRYLEDFETVLLNPEQHMRLTQVEMTMDRMGIQKNPADTATAQPVVFNDLIGYDQRNWTITMVYTSELQCEIFSTPLEEAYRMLAI